MLASLPFLSFSPQVSAKSGHNIQAILDAIVERIPAPVADVKLPMNALLFDSWYDDYKGVICLVAMLNGRLKKGIPGVCE